MHSIVVLAYVSEYVVPQQFLGYWKTIDDDYHWHLEIMPILPGKSKSYTFKEVYFTPVSSETAAARLREINVD